MNRDEIKARDKIVSSFTAKWKYRTDKEQFGAADSWKIIYSEDAEGKFVGDCEDYALCLVGPSKTKVSHAILRYKGEFVDNWTRKFGGKEEIEKNHTFHWLWGYGFAYQAALKMIISKIVRTIKSN